MEKEIIFSKIAVAFVVVVFVVLLFVWGGLVYRARKKAKTIADNISVGVYFIGNENKEYYLKAFLEIEGLDPVLLASATDGGAIARGGNVAVEMGNLDKADRAQFVAEVKEIAFRFQFPLSIDESVW